MDADTMLVVGLLAICFSIPAALSALSDRRRPTFAGVLVLLGAGLVVVAMNVKPGGYTLRDVPDAVYTVIAKVLP